MAEACEIVWHQGLDLYGTEDNRPLRGFEYTAKYNLGQDVPFAPYTDVTGKNKAKLISRQGRSRPRPICEMVWNHYARRRVLAAPFTQRAAMKVRPEGAAWSADHPSFRTLLFTLPEDGASSGKHRQAEVGFHPSPKRRIGAPVLVLNC